MLKQTSKNFKKFFLLQFTKELIRHAGAGEIFKLEQLLKEKEEHQKELIKSKEKIHEIIKDKEKELKIIRKEEAKEPSILEKIKAKEKKIVLPPPRKPVLRIPELTLPPTFQYLKPSATKTEIDLDKLNPLIKDPLVKTIECNGPDENIIVKGGMGTKPTAIVLKKDEIESVIRKFSEASKIPMQEGFFRAVVGRLILTAVISELIGSKFIIKKMSYSPGFNTELR